VPTVFLSYTEDDEEVVKALAEDIEDMGHEPWFDTDLIGAQEWWKQILSHIRASDVFVFAISRESLDSTACDREWRYAAELGKSILPVLVADGVAVNLLPPALSVIEFVDYRTQPRQVARLAGALNGVPPVRPLPEPLPEPPDVPLSHLGVLAEQIGAEATLSREEQSTLVLDLKRAQSDSANGVDVRLLLDRLRRRRDLLAYIAVEIDELLGRPEQPQVPATAELTVEVVVVPTRLVFGSFLIRLDDVEVGSDGIGRGGTFQVAPVHPGEHRLTVKVEFAGLSRETQHPFELRAAGEFRLTARYSRASGEYSVELESRTD